MNSSNTNMESHIAGLHEEYEKQQTFASITNTRIRIVHNGDSKLTVEEINKEIHITHMEIERAKFRIAKGNAPSLDVQAEQQWILNEHKTRLSELQQRSRELNAKMTPDVKPAIPDDGMNWLSPPDHGKRTVLGDTTFKELAAMLGVSPDYGEERMEGFGTNEGAPAPCQYLGSYDEFDAELTALEEAVEAKMAGGQRPDVTGLETQTPTPPETQAAMAAVNAMLAAQAVSDADLKLEADRLMNALDDHGASYVKWNQNVLNAENGYQPHLDSHLCACNEVGFRYTQVRNELEGLLLKNDGNPHSPYAGEVLSELKEKHVTLLDRVNSLRPQQPLINEDAENDPEEDTRRRLRDLFTERRNMESDKETLVQKMNDLQLDISTNPKLPFNDQREYFLRTYQRELADLELKLEVNRAEIHSLIGEPPKEEVVAKPDDLRPSKATEEALAALCVLNDDLNVERERIRIEIHTVDHKIAELIVCGTFAEREAANWELTDLLTESEQLELRYHANRAEIERLASLC